MPLSRLVRLPSWRKSLDSLHTSNCTTRPYRLCSLNLLWLHLPVVLVALGGTTLAVKFQRPVQIVRQGLYKIPIPWVLSIPTAWHLPTPLKVDAYKMKDLRKPCSDDNMVSTNQVSMSSKTFQNRTGPQALAKSLQIQPCFGFTNWRETGLQNDNPGWTNRDPAAS